MVGEDQYVFRFAGCDDRQSLIRAAAIIEEIGTKMLGDHFIKSGKFKALLTAVGLADVTDSDGNIDSGKVSMAVEMARALPPEPSGAGRAGMGPAQLRRPDPRTTSGPPYRAAARTRFKWVSLDYQPKKQEVQWQTLEVEKDRKPGRIPAGRRWNVTPRRKGRTPALQWQVLEHKKKDRDFDWRYLEVKKSTRKGAPYSFRTAAFPYPRNGVNGTERRLRPFVHLGARERRSGVDRPPGRMHAGLHTRRAFPRQGHCVRAGLTHTFWVVRRLRQRENGWRHIMGKVESMYLVRLARDRSEAGRRAFADALSDIFVADGTDMSDQERLAHVRHPASGHSRHRIGHARRGSASISPRCPTCPAIWAKILANDDIEVAYPILTLSTVLLDEDLIEVARNRTIEHQVAIAERPDISEEVSATFSSNSARKQSSPPC